MKVAVVFVLSLAFVLCGVSALHAAKEALADRAAVLVVAVHSVLAVIVLALIVFIVHG